MDMFKIPEGITFQSPGFLFLLAVAVVMLFWYFLFRRKATPVLRFGSIVPFCHMSPSLRVRLRHLPALLRLAAIVLLVVCLARPQTSREFTHRETEGIDVMIAMDISTSMLTPDINPNRLAAAKQVAVDFISKRPNDNIGLTLFGGEAFTQCPLTLDHAVLLQLFSQVSCDLHMQGVIAPGTAIGMGLASSLSHLQNSKSKSKVVILITDGENNTGEISPLFAAEVAASEKVRVYTILVGSDGPVEQDIARLPNGEIYRATVENAFAPDVLQEIARVTHGKYYKAASRDQLRAIYADIDRLEKTKMKVSSYGRRFEAYQPFALLVFVLLLLEAIVRIVVLRRIP